MDHEPRRTICALELPHKKAFMVIRLMRLPTLILLWPAILYVQTASGPVYRR